MIIRTITVMITMATATITTTTERAGAIRKGVFMPNDQDQSLDAEAEILETLDFVSASYDLQIQKHRELIKRRRQRRERSEYSQTAAAPDFLIRPRRAA